MECDYAWAAGFFDGEGTTGVLKAMRDKHTYLRMSISQKNPELLYKFQSIFNCGSVYKSKTREIYSWNCYRHPEIESILHSLWPYLGEQKKQQADLARSKVTSKGHNKDAVNLIIKKEIQHGS